MSTGTGNNRRTRKERVCIIGAGVSGIAALKVFKQNGFDAIAYEKSSTIGKFS